MLKVSNSKRNAQSPSPKQSYQPLNIQIRVLPKSLYQNSQIA